MIQLAEASYISTNFFSKIKCEPLWKWPKREQSLENYDLFYVWEGTGEVNVQGQTYSVKKGSCFLFRQGDYPSATHNQQNGLTITYIHFNINGAPQQIPAIYRMILDPMDIEIMLSRYVHLRLSTLYAANEEAQLILKQLMIYLLRSDHSQIIKLPKTSVSLQNHILEIANYIREHPATWFKIAELANRAQLSPRYFSTKFKEIIGATVQEYEITCRMNRAEFLLHYCGMSVAETADALGYKDVYFFSKQFKQQTGQNPSKIR